MNNMLEKIFDLTKRGTDVKTEILAGVATFLTMAYIIVVNPAILSKTGMPFPGVLFATVLVCAFSSIAMGLFANLPYGVAPGMGINAFFTFTLVLGMGVRWETALGAVFISGIIFIILSLTGVRTEIIKAIPVSLRYGVAVGIGIFLALIGLQSVGFIVSNKATVVGFGNLNLVIILFLVGFFLTSILVIKNIRGALIIGITATSLISLAISVIGTSAGWLASPIVKMPKGLFALPTLDVFMKLDIAGALSFGMFLPIFTLLFTDMFDSISTFLGVAEVASLIDENGQPVNVEKALLTDAFSTTISGLIGSSSGTTYIESAVGVGEGGRTGLTAVTIGLLFLPFMFLSPLLSFIPPIATAHVLVLVGVFMTQPLMKIDWKNFEEAIPAFLAVILVPLTYSITQGIIWGFLTYTIIKLFLGKGKEVHWMLYIIDAFAILSLVTPLL